MYHKGGGVFSNFNNWWKRHDLKYASIETGMQTFRDFRFRNGLNKGDIIFMIKVKPEKIKIGDIIAFDAKPEYSNPIIHRVIKIEKNDGKFVFSTIGDNNNGQLTVEKQIKEDKLVGKIVFRVAPSIGWGKLIFYDWKNPASERGFCKEN